MANPPPPDLMQGHTVWNSSHRNNPNAGLIQVEDFTFPVFAGGFSMMEFRCPVEFINCTFPVGTEFVRVQFHKGVKFTGSRFEGDVNFRSSRFVDMGDFTGVQFAGGANLESVGTEALVFASSVVNGDFHLYRTDGDDIRARLVCSHGATFRGSVAITGRFVGVDFSTARFEQPIKLASAVIDRGGANFGAAVFGSDLTMEYSSIGGPLIFEGAEFMGGVYLYHAPIKGPLNCGQAVFHEYADFSGEPDSTLPASNFTDAVFHDRCNFEYRKFIGLTSFKDATFWKAPAFHNCELYASTYFDGSTYRDWKSGDAEACYRSLRHCCKKIEHARWELSFFELEMRARRAHEPNEATRALYAIYEWTSNYGRSIARPLWWFVGIQVLAFLTYTGIENASAFGALTCGKPPHSCTFDSVHFNSLLSYTLAQALPFIPALKEAGATVTVTPGWKPVAQFATVVHGILSVVLLFLVGLGLRNLFRLKQ